MSKNIKWIGLGIIGVIFMWAMIIPKFANISFGPKIGIVEINTPITTSFDIIKNLNYFLDREDIDAIIVRLDTPGGSVAPSQEIFEKVKSISESKEKPIIASMGSVAASGGYYIALGADVIIANPGTATGSIGVIMSYPIASELLDKIGLNYATVKSGNLKDSGSMYRKPTSEDLEYFQLLIDNLHHQFVNAVSEQRKIELAEVKRIANGQVYSGEQALELGLIDKLGTLEDAIELASKLANITEKPKIVFPPETKKSIVESLLSTKVGNIIPKNLVYPIPEYRLY